MRDRPRRARLGGDAEAIARWAEQIARLTALGKRVILVSSGAIRDLNTWG